MADPAGSEDERAALALIAAADAMLPERKGIPKDFAAALFAHTAPEDLRRYQGSEIATLAEAAWALLARRQPRTPNVRLAQPAASAQSVLGGISVLEIVNDDMPFLVDSVLGELTEYGLDVRLVAHPVFTVSRDKDGGLFGFATSQPASGGAQRESFIHIHVDRIDDDARRAEIVSAVERVLADVRVCVQDWRPMKARVDEII